MPWVRSGDNSATYPLVMSVAGLPGADGRSVNEVYGFVARLAMLSASHTTDYVVDAGTVAMIGGANTDDLVKLCKKVGLLRQCRVDGRVAYKVIDDPDFLHLRLKAEIEWERQQKADAADPKIAVPVRFRDGDQCRYCGVVCMWLGRPSGRTATFDHLDPGEAGTAATVVVACRSCNSGLREIARKDRVDQLRPEPARPYYSEYTAGWLNENGHADVEPSAERPGIQPDPAPRRKATRTKNTTTGQRPDRQSDPALSDSDPATSPDPARTEVDLPTTSEVDRQAKGTGSGGTGRDGSGNARALSSRPTTAGTERSDPAGSRRRKRSARGRQHRPPPGSGS